MLRFYISLMPSPRPCFSFVKRISVVKQTAGEERKPCTFVWTSATLMAPSCTYTNGSFRAISQRLSKFPVLLLCRHRGIAAQWWVARRTSNCNMDLLAAKNVVIRYWSAVTDGEDSTTQAHL